MLEEGSFRGRTADFVFMFMFGGVIMTVSLTTFKYLANYLPYFLCEDPPLPQMLIKFRSHKGGLFGSGEGLIEVGGLDKYVQVVSSHYLQCAVMVTDID